MPEGDTLFHYAARLRPILVGSEVRRVDGRYPERMRGLVGTVVDRVDSIGKHLLIGFSDETSLRVHLGMKGTIHRYAPGERWHRPFSSMGWLLGVDGHEVVGFYPKALERFSNRDTARVPALAHLGPDLLKDPLDLAVVVERYRKLVDPAEAIGIGLLDQRPACGIGNIYRCETLFVCRTSPHLRSADVDNEHLCALYGTARDLLRANVKDADVIPRTTTFRAERASYVYEQHRSRCLVCRGPISVDDQAALNREYVRLTWWCPTCQAVPAQVRNL